MDKALFSSMVKELLLRDGKVELPGLGVLRFVIFPASFSDKGFTLNPPYKKVVFTPSDVNAANGFAIEKPSCLASLYSRANNIPPQRAIIAVGEILEELRQSVTPSQDYDLPGLGRFRSMMDGSLFFVQSPETSVCPAFDNLPAVSLKSLQNIHEPAPVPAPASAAEEKSAVIQPADLRPVKPQTQAPATKAHHTRAVAWTFGAVAMALVMALASLAVLGRINPELVDPLLYSPEQLDVLYSRF